MANFYSPNLSGWLSAKFSSKKTIEINRIKLVVPLNFNGSTTLNSLRASYRVRKLHNRWCLADLVIQVDIMDASF